MSLRDHSCQRKVLTRFYGLLAYLIHRNGVIGFTVLQCIIVIEFVKNIRNIQKSIGLLWFYFVCFEIWKKPSKAGRQRAPSSGHCVVHVWKIRRDPIGAAFRQSHVPWVHRCIGHKLRLFCELSSSFVQSFAWVSDGLLALLSLKISQVSTNELQNSWKLNSDLRVIHHQWRPPDLATFQVSVNCTWNEANPKHWLAGFAGFVLAQKTELAWDFWKFHGVWEVQKSKTQQSCWSDFGPVWKICQSGVSFEDLFRTEAIVDFISCSGENTQETYSFVTLMALAKIRCLRWQHVHHKTAQHWHSIGRTSHSQAYQVKWPSKGGVINPCTSRYEKCENLLVKYAR